MASPARPLPTIGVVVSCFEQEEQIREAVSSVLQQTRVPAAVVVVDDGSSGTATRTVLDRLDSRVTVLRQPNAGVAAARNRGIAHLDTQYVGVLDGDDQWEPDFLARTAERLDTDGSCRAASSWMRMFGAADHLVRPAGGTAVDFLARNASPASAVFRRQDWERAGGYREAMRHGFEDWDFFLTLLEHDGRIEIVPEPLLRYRTHPASLNITSMTNRLQRYREIITNHQQLYRDHLVDALLALETTSIRRLQDWELLLHRNPHEPVPDPEYGDGGMAAAVRLASRPPRQDDDG